MSSDTTARGARARGATRMKKLLEQYGCEGLGTRMTLKEVFDILDDSHDGVVTRPEFLRNKTEVFYLFLKQVGLDQHLDPEDIKITPEAFAAADLNRDGKMSGAEFVRAPFSQFDAINANGDHGITFEEFREFIRRYQP